MLKVLGRKAELFNGFSKKSPDIKQLKEGALETQIEILTFFTGLVNYFRTESFGRVTPCFGPRSLCADLVSISKTTKHRGVPQSNYIKVVCIT